MEGKSPSTVQGCVKILNQSHTGKLEVQADRPQNSAYLLTKSKYPIGKNLQKLNRLLKSMARHGTHKLSRTIL